MPYDRATGLFYEWLRDPVTGAKTGRDFSVRDQIDDRWDIDKKTGEMVQVRALVSSAPPGPPESWPDSDGSPPTWQPNRRQRRLAGKKGQR